MDKINGIIQVLLAVLKNPKLYAVIFALLAALGVAVSPAVQTSITDVSISIVDAIDGNEAPVE